MSDETLFGQYQCPCCKGLGWVREIPSAPARPTDPRTSHASQQRNSSRDMGRFSAKSRQARLLELFSGGRRWTDNEATSAALGYEVTPAQFEGTRRRMSDLRAVGYLRDSGDTRCNPGSPDESILWQITLLGEKALACLAATGWSR